MGSGVRFGKGKKVSKRQSTKVRCKVEKKVREHGRKLRKEMKKNPGKFKKSKKDPGVPGDCPFKDQARLNPFQHDIKVLNFVQFELAYLINN